MFWGCKEGGTSAFGEIEMVGKQVFTQTAPGPWDMSKEDTAKSSFGLGLRLF